MIYDHPADDDPLDQGDLIDGCPVLCVDNYSLNGPTPVGVGYDVVRVIVMTQTCDFANQKVTTGIVAEVFDAQATVKHGMVKATDIHGPIQGGRVWGWYFLPADAALGLPEMVVDLRRLHTVRLDLLRDLGRAGRRRGRVRTLYREHLAKHFADTYSRIGLPRPYETI